MTITPQELDVILRRDFVSFIERSFIHLHPQTPFSPNFHIDMTAEALEKCRRGEIKRLIINVPPRSLKSLSVTVAFTAWLLGHNPEEQIITASYGQDLADKHAQDTLNLMKSSWYKRIFPGTRLDSVRPAVSDFSTTRNGCRLAVSVGGSAMGRGANIIIIDDPIKPDQALSETQRKNANDWFEHTLVTRLNNKVDGCIIIIMQRLHEDDLVGHISESGPGNWQVMRFPAIAEEDEVHEYSTIFGPRRHVRYAGEALHPEREPLHILEELRRTLGEYNFAGQYQQTPAPLGGGMIKAEWFKFYRPEERPVEFETIFQSWDTANKASELSDFSVCTTWGRIDGRIYLLDVYRKRVDYPNLKRAVKELAAIHGADVVLIEDKASGTQLLQELRYEGVYAAQAYNPTQEKVMRVYSVSIMIENGFVYFPEKANWLQTYLQEITTFPRSRHDDQADSTSQALEWAKKIKRGGRVSQFYADTGLSICTSD